MEEDKRFSTTSTEEERREAERVHFLFLDTPPNNKDMAQTYTETSDGYDKHMEVINYSGPVHTAATISKLFPSNRENVYILDIAAGTGLCAVEFQKHGFRKIDALDGSEGMVDAAKRKNLYGRYILEMLGENTLNIEDDVTNYLSDTYDVVTSSGLSSALLKVLPTKALEEMIRIVKPGGFVVNASFHTTFVGTELRRKMDDLESQGKWKQIEFTRFQEYSYGEDGGISVHKVCKPFGF